jgi:hypothetical protein
MNLFNEALKVYEDIHAEYPDNLDCLRGLVQIRKELGMKYQHFSEKLMALDREEEAKRIMMGGGAAGNSGGYGDRDYYGGGGPGGYDGQGMGGGPGMQPGGGDMMADIQPKARKMAAANKKQDEDDDNWGNVDALLE